QRDLYRRTEQPASADAVLRFAQRLPDRGRGAIDLAFRVAQQREPRMWRLPVLAGFAIRVVGRVVLTPQTLKLAAPVERPADRRVRGFGEALAGALGLVDRVGPVSLQLQDLGPMHQALAAVRHELGLRLAPPTQRCRPLACSADVEDLLARL